MSDKFHSSDSLRTAGPLKHARQVRFEGPFRLQQGGSLPEVNVTYETYGKLNERKDNAVFVCHAISGDSHCASHDADDDPGWWEVMVGPGKCIDTDRYFVVCPNILGGCRGTTGPNSINPETGRPYGADFPTITVDDIVDVNRLLVRHLGIEKLLAIVGGSMGGHQVLSWAARYPDETRGAIPLATSPRLTSQALAFDIVGRNAIMEDPNFLGGQYYEGSPGPSVGLAIARMIGHITYLSREAMARKFEADRYQPRDGTTDFESRFSIGTYLGYQGEKFVERFDANSYITLTTAMDLFDMGNTVEEIAAKLSDTRAKWLIVSFTSDWLFPPEQSEQLVRALLANDKPVTYCDVESTCGHDAFLLADDLDRYGELVRAFLANLNGEKPRSSPADRLEVPASPKSIFHTRRLDYDHILELIPPQTSVLDLGCGGGELLSLLNRRGNRPLLGVELDEHAIVTCVRRGLNVVHGDLNAGLDRFRDRQFDFVVLSHTLQAIRDVEHVVTDMLRVGRRCIVSFPNFAYHKLRRMLYEDGKAPESGLLHYKWYNSPNIRFFSIADFDDFCAEHGINVHQRIALDTEAGAEVQDEPNANADMAIFVLSR
ncbi:MAG: homoserine O-acetyltransferase MetX [Phycisphaerae bacterium]